MAKQAENDGRATAALLAVAVSTTLLLGVGGGRPWWFWAGGLVLLAVLVGVAAHLSFGRRRSRSVGGFDLLVIALGFGVWVGVLSLLGGNIVLGALLFPPSALLLATAVVRHRNATTATPTVSGDGTRD